MLVLMMSLAVGVAPKATTAAVTHAHTLSTPMPLLDALVSVELLTVDLFKGRLWLQVDTLLQLYICKISVIFVVIDVHFLCSSCKDS